MSERHEWVGEAEARAFYQAAVESGYFKVSPLRFIEPNDYPVGWDERDALI